MIGRVISSAEILKVLKGFVVDKSSSSDGWTAELFLHFYDLMGEEIIEAFEATRRLEVVPECLNLTYISLLSIRRIYLSPLMTIDRFLSAICITKLSPKL